jgi:hypothetical protein
MSLNIKSPYRRQKRDFSIIRLLFRRSHTGIEILTINIITFFLIISTISTIFYLFIFLPYHRLFPIFLPFCHIIDFFLPSCDHIIDFFLFSYFLTTSSTSSYLFATISSTFFYFFLSFYHIIDFFLPSYFFAILSTFFYFLATISTIFYFLTFLRLHRLFPTFLFSCDHINYLLPIYISLTFRKQFILAQPIKIALDLSCPGMVNYPAIRNSVN